MRSLDLVIRRPAPGTCSIRVGSGALARLLRDLKRDARGRTHVVISDRRVARLHGRAFVERMRAAGLTVELLTFQAGEAHKSRATKAALEDRLERLPVGRDARFLAFGGGVTGDLAGFVAATWHRGVPIVQVPTSLLAMVDASIGGKTGVNSPRAKNQIGAFHQPEGVYADVRLLDTLSAREFRQGLAEVIKTAAIADRKLFALLEDRTDRLLARSPRLLEEVVFRCASIKAAVVRRDERESGVRAMLNFGHTIGHAVEAVSGFRVRHGEAVAIGMVAEARLAGETLGFPEPDTERLERLIVACGLPSRIPAKLSARALLAATRRDKKVQRGETRYALPRRIGSWPTGEPCRTIEPAAARSAMIASGARGRN